VYKIKFYKIKFEHTYFIIKIEIGIGRLLNCNYSIITNVIPNS
jgi:hypothetical protein